MRITTKGIGAHDQDLELGRQTLLVGPNGSGKSKLAEAIRMVALGYVPALGKRPVDLAALMHGESMSVELAIDGGRTIRRTLERTGSGGFTAAADASWMRQAKPGEVSKAITKLFGDEEQDVAECLDIRQLLAATPNQRAARIEQLLAAGSRSPELIASDVARLIVMRLAETTEDRMPADYRDALPMVPDKQRNVLFDQAAMIKSKIVEAGIAGALTWANGEKRDSSEGLKKKSAAADELRKRAVQVPEPDERDIIRLEGEKSKILQQIGALRQQTQDFKTRVSGAVVLKDQLEAVQEIAERTATMANDAEAVHGKAAAELRERSDKVLEQMASLKLSPEEDDSSARAIEAEILELEKKLDGIKIPALIDCKAAEERVEDLVKVVEQAKASPWAEVLDIAKQLLKVKSAIERARRLEELARAQLGAGIDGFEHELERARKQLEEQFEASDAAAKLTVKRGREKTALRNEIDAKKMEVSRIRADIMGRRRDALQTFEAKRAELSSERTKLEKALATHRQALETARTEKSSVERRLTSLQDQIRGAGELPAEPPPIAPIEQKLKDSEAELARLIAARATHREIHNVLNEIDAAKAAAVVFAAIEWALQRQREVEISQAGGPLMRTMAEFLKAAGRKETPFIRASQGNCAIGWKGADGREIQIQALSGGEWCLFATALTAGVILCRKSVIKILLVEAGETDTRTLTQLLEGIHGVNKEELMTAIVMSPRAPSERVDHIEGWNVFRITEDKEAVSAAV